MRVLFVTHPKEDYLADSLFHGMRSLLGENCVDFPKCLPLYQTTPSDVLRQTYGRGFTLYTGLLHEIPIDRHQIDQRLASGDFDLVVFSNIWRQYELYLQFRRHLTPNNTIIVDGEDTAAGFPFAGRFLCSPLPAELRVLHRQYLYFKREWTPDTVFGVTPFLWHRLTGTPVPEPRFLRRIAFSIPEEKLVTGTPIKTKDFPAHIVDPEIAKALPEASSDYAFTEEASYYRDLQSSRYGITTKRAGWDCMRHYEIAANQCLPCFRELDRKPSTCAPHGLTSENAIIYADFPDLRHQIDSLSDDAYQNKLRLCRDWIQGQTTVRRAKQVIDAWRAFRAA